MPLPSDEQLVQTGQDLVNQLQAIFGKHPGFRPAHAKGIMLTGTYTPSATAAELSAAPHFSSPSTPITVRFSNSTGIPNIPDTDPTADPRGMAVRFNLGDRVHTDLICHSTPFFPTRTGAEFLDFLRAAATGKAPEYVGSHPSALAFVQAPKPAPSSYAREAYHGVTAFKLVSASGKATFVRYKIEPVLGVETLHEAALKDKDADYLQQEITERVKSGPFSYRFLAQVAEDGDVTDDATKHWPESRTVVDLGVFKVENLVPDTLKEQKHIIFDPIPRIKGLEPSDDPLLEMRAAVYLLSGRERRAA